ncbi:MAG: outer membrane beta-barrel protein [Rhodospirillales bacterium]|nr:outer membrane beta-barrel protein [Rhodospirillales bacterium]MCB9996122.1 outer membrane beta-barrel protein [Rhodospirillales bacterium]
MRSIIKILLLTAGFCLLSLPDPAVAASPSKGLKVDRLLQQAITETAAPEPEEEFIEEVPAEPPVFEEEVAAPEPEPEPAPPVLKLPTFPSYVEAAPEPKSKFKWPDKPGVNAAGLLFLPSVMIKEGWNSNLFTNDAMDDADLVTYFIPRLRVEIPDIRHEVAFDGSWEWRKHVENDDEDLHNIETSLGGHLSAANAFLVPFGFAWSSTHEEREDDLTLQLARNPIKKDNLQIDGGIQFKPNGFGIGLIGHYNKQRYENGISKLNAAPVVRDDANRDITELEFNTSFDLNPANTLMLWGTIGDRDYESNAYQNGGYTGVRRSSKSFSGMMSWMFDYEGLDGHMSAGLLDYNYDDIAMSDVREFVGDMELNHRITDNTLVNFQLARTIEEDDEVVFPILRSRAGLYVDHDFNDKVMMAAGADYNFREFNKLGRNDETWDFRALSDYFINDFLALGLEYKYTQRDSDVNGFDFRRNIFMLRARGRL